MSETREGLCRCDFCPAPSNPDWHQCIHCGALAVQHHHVRSRGMGGSKERKYDKDAVVPLCEKHHTMMTLHKYRDEIRDGFYLVWNRKEQVLVKKPMPTSNERRLNDDKTGTRSGLRSDSDGGKDAHSLGGSDGGGMGNKSLRSGYTTSGQADADVQGVPEGSGQNRAEEGGAPADNAPLTPLPSNGSDSEREINDGQPDQEASSGSHSTGTNHFRHQGVCLPSEMGSELLLDPYAAYEARAFRIAEAWQSSTGIKSTLTWEVGDVLNEAQDELGEMHSQIEAVFDGLKGLSPGRLGTICRVSRRRPKETRTFDVYFEHYAAVCAKNLEEQDIWLEQAEANQWTLTQLLDAIRGGPKPKVKRWTLEELEAWLNKWDCWAEHHDTVMNFLDWLQGQEKSE